MRTMTTRRAVALAIVVVVAGVLTASLHAAAPAGHFVVNGTIVTDTATGLVWQQQGSAGMNYATAKSYCTNNTPGLPGSGWRLPTIKELNSIFDPAANAPRWDAAFSGSAASPYWSSDSRPPACPSGGYCQLELDFNGGSVGSGRADDTTVMWYARCVR